MVDALCAKPEELESISKVGESTQLVSPCPAATALGLVRVPLVAVSYDASPILLVSSSTLLPVASQKPKKRSRFATDGSFFLPTTTSLSQKQASESHSDGRRDQAHLADFKMLLLSNILKQPKSGLKSYAGLTLAA